LPDRRVTRRACATPAAHEEKGLQIGLCDNGTLLPTHPATRFPVPKYWAQTSPPWHRGKTTSFRISFRKRRTKAQKTSRRPLLRHKPKQKVPSPLRLQEWSEFRRGAVRAKVSAAHHRGHETFLHWRVGFFKKNRLSLTELNSARPIDTCARMRNTERAASAFYTLQTVRAKFDAPCWSVTMVPSPRKLNFWLSPPLHWSGRGGRKGWGWDRVYGNTILKPRPAIQERPRADAAYRFRSRRGAIHRDSRRPSTCRCLRKVKHGEHLNVCNQRRALKKTRRASCLQKKQEVHNHTIDNGARGGCGPALCCSCLVTLDQRRARVALGGANQ
jgi:hypothetical protein